MEKSIITNYTGEECSTIVNQMLAKGLDVLNDNTTIRIENGEIARYTNSIKMESRKLEYFDFIRKVEDILHKKYSNQSQDINFAPIGADADIDPEKMSQREKEIRAKMRFPRPPKVFANKWRCDFPKMCPVGLYSVLMYGKPFGFADLYNIYSKIYLYINCEDTPLELRQRFMLERWDDRTNLFQDGKPTLLISNGDQSVYNAVCKFKQKYENNTIPYNVMTVEMILARIFKTSASIIREICTILGMGHYAENDPEIKALIEKNMDSKRVFYDMNIDMHGIDMVFGDIAVLSSCTGAAGHFDEIKADTEDGRHKITMKYVIRFKFDTKKSVYNRIYTASDSCRENAFLLAQHKYKDENGNIKDIPLYNDIVPKFKNGRYVKEAPFMCL